MDPQESAGIDRHEDDVLDSPITVPQRAVQGQLKVYFEESNPQDAIGDRILYSIDRFIFSYLPTLADGVEIFEFIDDVPARSHMARAFVGARWIQKVGLVLARPLEHQAHHPQVRMQIVEYGAIAEACLRIQNRQAGATSIPDEFSRVISQSKTMGILTDEASTRAHALRKMRNRIHLEVDRQGEDLTAQVNAREAYTGLISVIQACRRSSGFENYDFTQWRGAWQSCRG